jgi:hypothetical protein
MECNNFGLCETWVRAEDLGINLLNATGKGICKMCHLDSTLNACARLSALDEARHKALGLFNQMQWKGVQPVLVTFVGAVNGRASIYGN